MRVRTFFMILVLLGVLWGIAACGRRTATFSASRSRCGVTPSTTVAWLLRGLPRRGGHRHGRARRRSRVRSDDRAVPAAQGRTKVRGDRGGVLAGSGRRPRGARRRSAGPLPRGPRAGQPSLQHADQDRRGPAEARKSTPRRSSTTARPITSRKTARVRCTPWSTTTRPGATWIGPGSCWARSSRSTRHSVAAWRKLRSLQMKEGDWNKALEAHERVVKLSGPKDPHRLLRPPDRDRHPLRDRLGPPRRGQGPRGDRACSGASSRTTRSSSRPTSSSARRLPGRATKPRPSKAWFAGFEATGSPIFLTVLEEHYLQREQPLAAIEALKRCIASSRQGHPAAVLPRQALLPTRDARRRAVGAVLARGARELRPDAALPAGANPRAAPQPRRGQRRIPQGHQGDGPGPARVPLPGLRRNADGLGRSLSRMWRVAGDRGQLPRGDLPRGTRPGPGADLHQQVLIPVPCRLPCRDGD